MSRGDLGPYVATDGPDIWVPRTVPYLRARAVASEAIQTYGHRLHYIGKDDADLFGFTRDCQCEEVCEARYRDDEPTGARPCRVPAWHFEEVEP
jgi:hypothetical protein